MVSPKYPVSSIRTLFSLISIASILCFQLLSTTRFYTVRDQTVRLRGGTFLLSFISDGVVFPDPLLLGTAALTHSDPLGEALPEQ